MKIIIVGPSHPYRGGIAAFTDRLAAEFVAENVDVELYTFNSCKHVGNNCFLIYCVSSILRRKNIL